MTKLEKLLKVENWPSFKRFNFPVWAWNKFKYQAGNTKGGSITVLLTSCLTGLESAVWQLTIFIFICKTGQSKPVKQEVNSTVTLPPLVFPVSSIKINPWCISSDCTESFGLGIFLLLVQHYSTIIFAVATDTTEGGGMGKKHSS